MALAGARCSLIGTSACRFGDWLRGFQRSRGMAATNKDELVAITEKEFAKLMALLAKVPDGAQLLRDDENTSLKDVVGHRAHWIELFLGWYRDGQAGKVVHFPAEGYKWNDLKSYNAALRESQKSLGWRDAVAMLEANHAALLQLIASLDNDDLYGGSMKGANNDWTTGRWAEAAGPSHYRSAAKYIRQRLKALTPV